MDLQGFVADAELEVAYEQCLAFVYPGFGEGFGLPLLEAMHRGCACLVTNLGASPEIAGDAALYVDPYCQDNIVRGLRRVACLPDGERARFGMKARERSLVFTWKRFYDGLAEVIENQAA